MICDNSPGEGCDPDCDFYALDRFATIAKVAGFELDVEDFMYMGVVNDSSDNLIVLYKHDNTRRYLNLDSEGHAFKFGEGYEPYSNPVDAINHVLS